MMEKRTAFMVMLMMLTGCTSSNQPNIESSSQFYVSEKEDGWFYWACYLPKENTMSFDGVNLRYDQLPDHYAPVYENKEIVDKLEVSTISLSNGETTRDDIATVQAFLDEQPTYPLTGNELYLTTLDFTEVAEIINQAYEATPFNGKWQVQATQSLSIPLDDGAILSVHQYSLEFRIVAVHIDIYQDQSFLSDRKEPDETEKQYITLFRDIEKEIIETQHFHVIEDSADPILHQLHELLLEMERSGVYAS